jgi:hypothetical protein
MRNCALTFLKEQPLKKAVLQAVGRKTARASAKPTGFCKKLNILKKYIDKVTAVRLR